MIKKYLSSYFIPEKFIPGEMNEIRNRLVNAILAISVVFGFPIVLVTIIRIPVTGLLTNTILGVLLYLSIVLLLVFSRKIGYRLKVTLFVFACYFLGIASWWSVGVMGAGFEYLLIGSLLATMLLSERAGFHLILTSFVTALIIGLAFITGKRHYTFPVEQYVNSVFPWALQLGVTLFFTTIIMLVFIILNRYTGKSMQYFNEQNKQLAEINRELEKEVTERIKAEKASRESEEKFRNIFLGIRDLVIITDLDGNIREANPFFLKKTGYTEKEVKKMQVDQFLDEEQRNFIRKIYGGMEYRSLPLLELILVTKERKKIPVEVAAFPFRYGEEDLLLYVARDITDRKQVEQRMMQTMVTAEEKERTRLARDLHDELGPLLSTGKMYVQMLQEEKSPYQQKLLIGKIYESLDGALQSMRRISNNLSPHLLRNYGLLAAVESFVERIQEMYPVEIVTEFDLPARLQDNLETNLYRAIVELVNNSLKHGEVSRIAIRIYRSAEYVLVEYSDDGKGFDIRLLEKPHKGMGLLNIKSRIESLAGNLIAASEPGKGVFFKFIVPIAEIL